MIINSACLTGIREIEVRKRELHLSDDDVLVKTHAAGICGQDKNLYNGIIPPSGGLNTEMKSVFAYPYFYGHEAGGTVVEVGRNVRNYKPGDKVMAFAWVETYSDYFKAREDELEPVPEGLSLDLASLGEPTGCAVFSGLCSQIQLGDSVAVIGMGFAGQVFAQVANFLDIDGTTFTGPFHQNLFPFISLTTCCMYKEVALGSINANCVVTSGNQSDAVEMNRGYCLSHHIVGVKLVQIQGIRIAQVIKGMNKIIADGA